MASHLHSEPRTKCGAFGDEETAGMITVRIRPQQGPKR